MPPAMIFAAGKGTRMAPLTDTRPKPMVEVAGRPLIDYALDIVVGAGITRIVANTHYLPEALETHLSARDVAVVREDDLLETGGGLKNARPLLGASPVITLNADAVWSGPNPITALRRNWDAARMDALLCLVRLDMALGHVGTGDFLRDAEGRLTRGPGLIFGGAQMIRTDLLDAIPDTVFSLNLLWDRLLDARRLYGIVHTGAWCDVGQPESIPLAEALLDV